MFRSSFNRHARIIIDTGCQLIGDQPSQEIWPLISDHLQGYATKNGKKQWKTPLLYSSNPLYRIRACAKDMVQWGIKSRWSLPSIGLQFTHSVIYQRHLLLQESID